MVVVVVVEVAAVVRDSVRGAWDVWMMFVGRSVRAVNKRTAKAIKSLLKCRHKGENTLMDQDIGVLTYTTYNPCWNMCDGDVYGLQETP